MGKKVGAGGHRRGYTEAGAHMEKDFQSRQGEEGKRDRETERPGR